MKKLISFFVFIILNKLLLGQSFTANFTTVTGDIPGSSTTLSCFPVTVTGVGTIDGITKGLSQVCMNITHTKLTDIEVLLEAPDGTYVPLSILNGGTGKNYTNTCFTATATTAIKFGTAPFTGSYLPEGHLGAVNNGQNANGTWNLCIRDRRSNTAGSKGNLNSFTVTFNNTPAPPAPPEPTVASCTNTVPSSNTCATAKSVCDFNGICGSTIQSTTNANTWTELVNGTCFGIDNNIFIKFIASASTASFDVWIPVSTGGTDGGLQMIFFEGTCGSGTIIDHGCYWHVYSYPASGKPLDNVITASGLTPGNTYYLMLDGLNGAGASFTITANSGVNILNIAPADTTICSGQSTNLSVTGGNNIYSWSPTTGLNTTSGSTVTATPASTTTYTVSSTTLTGCPLTKDVKVTVNIAPVITSQPDPNGQSLCQDFATLPLSISATILSGTINYQWYTNSTYSTTGGTLIPGAILATYTPPSNVSGTFYYYCIASNTAGTCSDTSDLSGAIIINPSIATPTASVTQQPNCTTPIGTITVTGPVDVNIQYSIGGLYQTSGVFTGLTPGTTYSVIARDMITGCTSPALDLTINNATGATPVPTVTNPAPYCQNVTAAALTATGTNLLWYTAATGGIGSATAIIPGTTSAGSTTYYVSQTVSGCESPRAVITVTVSAAPVSPTTTPVSYCQNNTAASLTATGTNLLWYTAATGGAAFATAPTPSTTANGNTIYYVSQTVGGCESPRAAITVTVNPTPAAPVVTTPVIYCQNENASALTATGSNLLWYTAATGGVGSATAPSPSTTSIGSTTYYVSQTSGCESPRMAITVTVNAIPVAPVVSTPVIYCQNETAVALSATGTNLLWYTAATGGVGSVTAPTPSTATSGSTTYYVSQTLNGCESPRAAISVTINAAPVSPTVTTPVIYCQNNTATALTATGTSLLWYTAATGGIGSATAPTPATTANGSTIYYVSQTVGGCESPRVSITVTVNTIPVAPVVTTPVIYCQNVTATALTATGTNLLWYTAATGGVGSATAPSPSTTSIGSTTYYVSQTSGCESPRVAITVTVNAIPVAPVVSTPVIYCQNETAVALSATGTNLLWYTAATGGVGSVTTPTPSTAASGSTTYFVSQTSGCESPRAAITVTVNVIPVAPVVTTPVIYCQNETAIALTATGTNLLWYTASTGGVGSATAPTLSTTSIGSTTYYVSQTSSCESPRAAITVTVNAIPAAPVVTTPVIYCQNVMAAALTATGSNLLWYTAATGGVGSATAPIPSTTSIGSTTYYVSQTNSCESPRAAIVVTVNAIPAAPVVTTPVIYCQNETAVALTATGTNLLWYTAAIGGVGSASAPTPSTATSGSTTYYVSQTSGCESPRAAISVTINAAPVSPTVTTPVIYCQNNTAVALTATGTSLLWYTGATGGIGSATAPTPSTTANGNTIYYVSQTVSGCESQRAAITVTVNAIPTAPAVISQVTYCQNVTAAALTATGTNLLWYTAAIGGAGSATAPIPSTTSAGSTTYYVSQTVSGCEGPRVAISATINAIPAAPVVTTPVAYCQNVTATALTATGTNLLWYAAATGGTGSATSPTPPTTSTGSKNYYVSQTTTGCESPRAVITVTINANVPPGVSNADNCGPGTVTLSATGSGVINWYTDPQLANLVNTGNSYSPVLTVTTKYYVTNTTILCTSSPTTVTASINSIPLAPVLGNDTAICEGDKITLDAGAYANYLWQDGTTGRTYVVSKPGVYSVQVGNSNGCTNSASINIGSETDCSDIYFPSAFAPDGKNNLFGPVSISGSLSGITRYALTIYNRYGQIVFISENPAIKWDGTFKGKKMGNNSFVWYANYLYRGRVFKKQKGMVTLIR